jgi:hypothetical protein
LEHVEPTAPDTQFCSANVSAAFLDRLEHPGDTAPRGLAGLIVRRTALTSEPHQRFGVFLRVLGNACAAGTLQRDAFDVVGGREA